MSLPVEKELSAVCLSLRLVGGRFERRGLSTEGRNGRTILIAVVDNCSLRRRKDDVRLVQ